MLHKLGSNQKLLEEVGYHIHYKVLNSCEYGNIPQNRERIYIIGFLNKIHYLKFKFPSKIRLTKTINDCFQNDLIIDEKYSYKNSSIYDRIKDTIIKENTVYQWRRHYVRENKSNLCPTLTANMGSGGHNVGLILINNGIRKLTPRECFNFQGFPKSYKLPDISDSQLYKQIGNSVTVPVITRIAKKIYKALSPEIEIVFEE